MARLDWAGLMRLGMSREGLGLAPQVFWELSPVEFIIMSGLGGGEAPLGRKGLEALMAAWPDGERAYVRD